MQKPSSFRLLLVGLFCTLLTTGACKKEEKTVTPTLYERLGKVDGISRIVDQLIANVGAECATPSSVLLRTHSDLLASTLPGSADPTRLERLRGHFIDQLGANSGGPATYSGMNMVMAHLGMAITPQEFAIWREQLRKSLDTNMVGAQEQTEVFAIMDGMQAQIVGQ